MDKKLLLTVQWACNIKGVKIPWEIVATEMGPTITAGAVIQHLAKFRQRMVAQGAEVPPALTRGSNNHGPAPKAAQNGKADRSKKADSTRRKAKAGGRMAIKDEDSRDDTEEEDFDMNDESEIEASQDKPNKPKGTTRTKGRNSKAAQIKQQVGTEISDKVKDEHQSSMERESSQTRYGVGDEMWPEDAYQSPKRTRTSESTSQSPQSPTKLVILNIGRAGFTKLGVTYNEDEQGPSDSNSCQETVASDPYSDSNNETSSNDYSMADDPSNRGADISMHHGLLDDFGMDQDEVVSGYAIGHLPHSSLEDQFVTSPTVYNQDNSNIMSRLEGEASALTYDARANSRGNGGQFYLGGHNSAGVNNVANPDVDNQPRQTHRFMHHSFGSPSKPADRVRDYTGPLHSGHYDSSDMAHIAARGQQLDHPPHPPPHGSLYSTRAPYSGDEGIDNFPDPEIRSTNDSHPGSHSYTNGGVRSSYSSTDSYHPVGGEFPGYYSMGAERYNETPVALSRSNSEFDCMASHLHSQPDNGTHWGPFFDENFDY
ncbi:MAG: hypothetical protein Q9200_007047 [Gallowayella weberi]